MAKTKMKTKKAAKKRFKFTGNGKIMRRQTGQRHLLSKKSSHRKRRLSEEREITGGDARRVRNLMPWE